MKNRNGWHGLTEIANYEPKLRILPTIFELITKKTKRAKTLPTLKTTEY